MKQVSNFVNCAAMNTAFGNPQGDPHNIDWERVRKQCKNIGDEFIELLDALGAQPNQLRNIREVLNEVTFDRKVDVDGVRDGLCDIHVFAYGAHHFLGIDADDDMNAVVAGVMTRFIKDDNDLHATVAKFAAKGVTEVYTEGSYPTMILKSAKDQPDAPKGKFLKAVSYTDTMFTVITRSDKADDGRENDVNETTDRTVAMCSALNDIDATEAPRVGAFDPLPYTQAT